MSYGGCLRDDDRGCAAIAFDDESQKPDGSAEAAPKQPGQFLPL